MKQTGSFKKEADRMIREMKAIAQDSGRIVERDANVAKPDFVNIQRVERIMPEAVTINIGVQTREDDMHAYLEFGTGSNAQAILANADPEVKQIAITYYKTGDGTLRGRPYFYPAFFAEAPQYIEKLRKYVRARS